MNIFFATLLVANIANANPISILLIGKKKAFTLNECKAIPFENFNWAQFPKTDDARDEYLETVKEIFNHYGKLKKTDEFKEKYVAILDTYLSEISELPITTKNFEAIERELAAQNQEFKDCLASIAPTKIDYSQVEIALRKRLSESVQSFDSVAIGFIDQEGFVNELYRDIKRFEQITQNPELDKEFLKDKPEIRADLFKYIAIVKEQIDGKYSEQLLVNPEQKCYLKDSVLMPKTGFNTDTAYPNLALEKRLSGQVKITNHVNQYGELVSLKLEADNPLFAGSTVEKAARSRVFTPNVKNCISSGGDYTYTVKFSTY